MLSLYQKQQNLHELSRLIENEYLPAVLGDAQFPNVDTLISLVCEFNQTLTQGPNSENQTPGKFRAATVLITRTDYTPPPAVDVRSHMVDFAHRIVRDCGNNDWPQLHAYVLWRLNWIHPFYDGNGRTARQFSYFLLCVKFGKLLPGRLTIIQQIQARKEEHYEALGEADGDYPLD